MGETTQEQTAGAATLNKTRIDEIRRDAISALLRETNNLTTAAAADRIRAAELLLRLAFDFDLPGPARTGIQTNQL